MSDTWNLNGSKVNNLRADAGSEKKEGGDGQEPDLGCGFGGLREFQALMVYLTPVQPP